MTTAAAAANSGDNHLSGRIPTVGSAHLTSYIGQVEEHGDSSIVFALKDRVGVLAEVLHLFQQHEMNLKHIESRSSRKLADSYEFFVVLDGQHDTTKLLEELKLGWQPAYLEVMSREREPRVCTTSPWFPRRIADLDTFSDNILIGGAEFHPDHPGFRDQGYRSRRKYFSNLAKKYRHGEPIPKVDYNEIEINTWRSLYDRVVDLNKKYACKEYNHIFPLMEANCGFNRDNIPQLEEVSRFLKDSTGFTLRPVAGLLSSRDFLAGLAYRVFHSTQYIRHHDNPNYTPEPDICHELLGHAPLFADPDFANFSQELGLASLGAPDEFIEKLATCYWFTIEFGLCKQDNQIKAYGAGLLSSPSELEHAMSGKAKILPFLPSETGKQKYPITEYQPVYFLAESFPDAQVKLHDYAAKVTRPVKFRYNPYTQSIETLSNKTQIRTLVAEAKSDLALVAESLERFSSNGSRLKP